MKRIVPFLFLFLLLLTMSKAANAQSCTTAVCNATGPSESAVLAALPSPSNTNSTVVVNIPSGTAAWTTGLSYTVPAAVTNLTIQGATTVNCTGTAGSSSWSCPASDSTVIQDTYASNNPLMTLYLGGAGTQFRITGLTMEGGNIGGSYSKYNGFVFVFSGASQLRYDHNHCNMETYSPANTSVCLRFYGTVTGVADHNRFDMDTTGTSYSFGISVYSAVGDSIGNGDGTWANATPWGSANAFYIESNYLNGGVIDDCGNAGSFVARYNTMNGATVAIQTHGTKTPAGPERGCRSYEAYHNYIVGPSSVNSAALGSKVGTSLVWGNTMPSGYYRFAQDGADRNNGDEVETNTPNGWGYCGTANGAGSQWDGNTSSSTGYPCLDGIGRGQTAQALNGANFPNRLNSATGTIAWPHQYLEPIYMWNNSIGSATYTLIDDSSVNNQDYYYDCGSGNSSCSGGFTGTAGTGSGTLASRPSTCTAGRGGTYYTSPTGSYGVAYFATDANNGNGELYVCSSTNTWTPIYQPYVYPHPLVSGASTQAASPAPPTNLVSTAD